VNLGFEVVSAKSKKADVDSDLAFEPMRQRARKEPRKQPSTDEKKVKRRLTKSAVAWSRRDSLDYDTEYVRQVLLNDRDMLEALVSRDDYQDEPTWAWLVYVADRADGGILDFVMSGSASGLDEAKGKADVALDRAEMDMMFERFSSRKQAASDQQETHRLVSGYLSGYNGDPQPDDNAPYVYMMGYSEGRDDLEQGNPPQYTEADLMLVEEDDEFDAGEFFDKQGVKKMASGNYYVFDEYPDDTGWAERPLAGPFATVEEASFVLKDVAYPFQFPYGPATVVGDLFIASELNEMSGEDFINQTMGSRRKRAGYSYQPDTQSSFDVQQYDQSPGQPFDHPSGHTYNGPDSPEATDHIAGRSSTMKREADILNAMRFASLEEQKTLMGELNAIRANRKKARAEDRAIDLTAAVITDRLTPVLTKSMHTVATDWLDEVADDDDEDEEKSEKAEKEASREMVAQATVWFKRLSAEVVADREEFAEQARGKARQLTSSLGSGRQSAIASFLDAAAHLRSRVAAGPFSDDEDEWDDFGGEDAWLDRAYEDRFELHDNDMDFAGSKQANEIMGYDGDYATNAGAGMDDSLDMPMDDSVDMDPRYETNASRKTASLTVQDLLNAVNRRDHNGFGYRDAISTLEWMTSPSNFERDSDLAERGESHKFPPFTADDVHRAVIEQANRLGLDEEELFLWANSKDARHFGDELTFHPSNLSGLVSQYLNKSVMDALLAYEAEYLGIESTKKRTGSKKRRTASSRKRASRKTAEWDQAAFDAWFKKVDRLMSARSGLGADDLPDQPYADWFEDGMSPQEAAQLALDEVADEMGFGGLFSSRRKRARKVARQASPQESRSIPAGSYVVGDPCYSVADDEWMPWLENANYRNVDLLDASTPSGHRVVAVGTAYGDGSYPGSDGFDYGVDAGLIGVVPLEYAENSGNGTWRHACSVHNFSIPFTLARDEDGTIFISGLEIPTGDTSDDDDYWDDEDEDNGYYSSRKQAMPSDDLIDVDIEDYMGGEFGPNSDSQSGHAETALPYAGDDTTPAFRETGWTGKRRKRGGQKTSQHKASNGMNAFEVAETLSAHESDAIMAAPFVARDYHSGQSSAMYALVSSGTMLEGLASEAREAADIAEEQGDYESEETLSILADVAERLGF
jgi:hypothetical protein